MSFYCCAGIYSGSEQDIVRNFVGDVRRNLPEPPRWGVVFTPVEKDLRTILGVLKREYPQASFIGCTSAGQFAHSGLKKDGVSLFALAGDFRVHSGLGRGMSQDLENCITEAVKNIPAEIEGFPYRTGVMLLDVTKGNGEEATLSLALRLGGIRLAGGAAGDDLSMQKCLVGCDDQVSADAIAVSVLFTKVPLGVGVAHGHKAVGDKLYRITRAEGNTVYEVEGRPAWEVWKEIISRERGVSLMELDQLPDEEKGALLLRYEAGLPTGRALKIRAPLKVSGSGELFFACGIPEGSEIHITDSGERRQVESARQATIHAREQVGKGKRLAGALVFDCICRHLILSDDFGQAVTAIGKALDAAPFAGFETYGEIAMDVGDMSGFHNTTTSVLVFPAE